MSGAPARFGPRQVVPRWRTAQDTLQLGELDPLDSDDRPRATARSEEFERLLARWNDQHSITAASELVGSALVRGGELPPELADASALLRSDPAVKPLAARAGRALQRNHPTRHLPEPPAAGRPRYEDRIRQLKARLNADPSHPFVWADLAWLQVTLGHRDAAQKAMRAALALAPNSRFVVRAAARLYTHQDELERARHVVAASAATAHDPWLMAADIALADLAGVAPSSTRTARRLVEKGDLAAWHVSELASALATIELKAGSVKRARKLFRIGLEDPTDNSIAQAQWAAREDSRLNLEVALGGADNTFEASAQDAYQGADFRSAVDNARLWQRDQPFEPRPAQFGSFLASEGLDDHTTAIELARNGWQANPQNAGLINNLAFSYLRAGQVEGASDILGNLRLHGLPPEELIPALATLGLLAYRQGRPDIGRERYIHAGDVAQDAKRPDLLVFASIYMANEEQRLGSPEARDDVALAAARAEEVIVDDNPQAELIRRRLRWLIQGGDDGPTRR